MIDPLRGARLAGVGELNSLDFDRVPRAVGADGESAQAGSNPSVGCKSLLCTLDPAR